MQEGAVHEEGEELVEGVRKSYLAWGEMRGGLSVCKVQGSKFEGTLKSH